MSLDLIVFFYLAVVATVGILVSRKREQSEDYFLASRNLTWWIIGGSMIAANISTHQKTLQRDSRGTWFRSRASWTPMGR
jgi:Na+/proline symporter